MRITEREPPDLLNNWAASVAPVNPPPMIATVNWKPTRLALRFVSILTPGVKSMSINLLDMQFRDHWYGFSEPLTALSNS
jgi:hypothetical protein